MQACVFEGSCRCKGNGVQRESKGPPGDEKFQFAEAFPQEEQQDEEYIGNRQKEVGEEIQITCEPEPGKKTNSRWCDQDEQGGDEFLGQLLVKNGPVQEDGKKDDPEKETCRKIEVVKLYGHEFDPGYRNNNTSHHGDEPGGVHKVYLKIVTDPEADGMKHQEGVQDDTDDPEYPGKLRPVGEEGDRLQEEGNGNGGKKIDFNLMPEVLQYFSKIPQGFESVYPCNQCENTQVEKKEYFVKALV